MTEIKPDFRVSSNYSQADGSEYFFVDLGTHNTRKDAELQKQQILSEHEIVENVKKIIGSVFYKDLDESIKDVKNGQILTYDIDAQNKPYIYSDSPLLDDCIHALQTIKKIQSVLKAKQ